MVQAVNVVNSTTTPMIPTLGIQTTTVTSILPQMQPKTTSVSATQVTCVNQQNAVATAVSSTTKTMAIAPRPEIQTVTPFSSTSPGTQEQVRVASEPPGTIVKCITAQVVQTPEGPRIMLQGLQKGDPFSPEQLQAIQQQVKQELLKGELIG